MAEREELVFSGKLEVIASECVAALSEPEVPASDEPTQLDKLEEVGEYHETCGERGRDVQARVSLR